MSKTFDVIKHIDSCAEAADRAFTFEPNSYVSHAAVNELLVSIRDMLEEAYYADITESRNKIAELQNKLDLSYKATETWIRKANSLRDKLIAAEHEIVLLHHDGEASST